MGEEEEGECGGRSGQKHDEDKSQQSGPHHQIFFSFSLGVSMLGSGCGFLRLFSVWSLCRVCFEGEGGMYIRWKREKWQQ